MKILKALLVLLGLAGVIGAIVYTYLGWLDLRNLVAVAESMRSAPQPNPSQELMIGIGLALVGGLVLGIGIGMPRRSQGRIRKETLQAVATGREQEIRDRARGYGATDAPAGRRDGEPYDGPATDPQGRPAADPYVDGTRATDRDIDPGDERRGRRWGRQ